MIYRKLHTLSDIKYHRLPKGLHEYACRLFSLRGVNEVTSEMGLGDDTVAF